MNNQTALVTGASGFIGSRLVKKLSERGIHVKAGVRKISAGKMFSDLRGVDVVELDILDRNSIKKVMRGADTLYHFAALVDSGKDRESLCRVNMEGTRNLWISAAECGVKKALYCSSTAVYGLLSKSDKPITEDFPARAIEPYGYSKLMGEQAALEIAEKTGLLTLIIRPVAVFGPGEHTPFGREIRSKASSKIFLAGAFQNRSFNFVHVEDVASAAIHVMEKANSGNEIFNVAGSEPVLFQNAFDSYIAALRNAGRSFIKIRMLALISKFIHRYPELQRKIADFGENHFTFILWHPGFDKIYSSSRLLNTSFCFRWNKFEEVLLSCIREEKQVSEKRP